MYAPYEVKVPLVKKDGSVSPYAGQKFYINNYYDGVEMVKRQNDKACRLQDELQYNVDGTIKSNKQAYFITLTYADDCLPCYDAPTDTYYRGLDEFVDTDTGEFVRPMDVLPSSVYSRDVQNFMKRLRKRYCTTPDRELRFYCTEEYGENNTRRPHYHLLVYPSHFVDEKTFSDMVSRAWSVKVSRAEFNRIANKNETIRLKSNRRKLFVEYAGRKTATFKRGNITRYYAAIGRSATEVPRDRAAVCSYVSKYITKPQEISKPGAKKVRCFGSQGLGIGYAYNPENIRYHCDGDIDTIADRYRHPLPGREKDRYPSLPKSYRKIMFSETKRMDIVKSLIRRGKIWSPSVEAPQEIDWNAARENVDALAAKNVYWENRVQQSAEELMSKKAEKKVQDFYDSRHFCDLEDIYR